MSRDKLGLLIIAGCLILALAGAMLWGEKSTNVEQELCYNITIEATTPAPSIIIEPAEVIIQEHTVVIQQEEYISTFQGKEYLIRDMTLRAIYNSDKRTWLRKSLNIEYTSDGIWAVKVKYTNGKVEYFTFNEKYGWID